MNNPYDTAKMDTSWIDELPDASREDRDSDSMQGGDDTGNRNKSTKDVISGDLVDSVVGNTNQGVKGSADPSTTVKADNT